MTFLYAGTMQIFKTIQKNLNVIGFDRFSRINKHYAWATVACIAAIQMFFIYGFHVANTAHEYLNSMCFIQAAVLIAIL